MLHRKDELEIFLTKFRELCEDYQFTFVNNSKIVDLQENYYVDETMELDYKEYLDIPQGGRDTRGPFFQVEYKTNPPKEIISPLDCKVNIGDSYRIYANKKLDPGFKEVINNIKKVSPKSTMQGF